MKTGTEYKESLRGIRPIVSCEGQPILSLVEHPITRPYVNAAAVTYDLCFDPEFADLLTATSHLTEKRINRFTHVHQSTDDLVKKVRMLRLVSQKTRSCFLRCAGNDAINAVYSVTYEIDQALKTNYHSRFIDFLRFIQETDFMIAAMNVPYEDCRQGSGQSFDPIRIVRQDEAGVVIRGSKQNMIGIINSHYMLVMPSMALGESEKACAVCCAFPIDAPGVYHIFEKQTGDTQCGQASPGDMEFCMNGEHCLTVLEDVFVPWEKVFLHGEVQFSGLFAERFSSLYRQTFSACKGGRCDIITGAAAGIGEFIDACKLPVFKEKIIEMIHIAESIYAGSMACSIEGRCQPCGSYSVDPVIANAARYNTDRYIHEIARLCKDIPSDFSAFADSEQKNLHSEPTADAMELYRLIAAAINKNDPANNGRQDELPQAVLSYQKKAEQKKRMAKQLAQQYSQTT